MANNQVENSIQIQIGLLIPQSSEACIYEVPQYIRSNRPFYHPSVVSIGPLHQALRRATHVWKLKHLKLFLGFGKDNHNLASHISMIRTKEEEIRSYYTKTSSLPSNEFVEMVMIDASFIIAFFMWFYNATTFSDGHPIKERFELANQVQHDLFLEENQIPFFILRDLYNRTTFGQSARSDPNGPHVTFEGVICHVLSKCFLPGREFAGTNEGKQKLEGSNVKHLVDFLRICCLPTKPRSNPSPPTVNGNVSTSNPSPLTVNDNVSTSNPSPLTVNGNVSTNRLPSKTIRELKAAGVTFKASESKNLLDITFSNGVLQIPKLTIQDTTEAVLRNIVFYEQCHKYNDSFVIDYLYFLDGLINAPEDVQILVEDGIIEHYLGSDEKVAALFNHITDDVAMVNERFYYADTCGDLNAHANIKCNKWKAILRRDYFNHPWSIISLIYLVVLLILTVLQVDTGFKSLKSS